MPHQAPPEHFKGKSVSDHLKEARKKGATVSAETHSSEMPGALSAGIDSARDMAFAILLLWAASFSLSINPKILFVFLICFSFGWILWKGGRSALLGWGRLERLHKVIEEERWEIEHHREQEKEELREMYEAKGFKGDLLSEVVEVLMSDDNRLLQIMLEEELGLSLEVYDHPLKQAFSAVKWAFFSALIALTGYYFFHNIGLPISCMLIILLAVYLGAKYEKRAPLPSMIWNFSIAAFATLGVYFFGQLL